MKRLAYDDPLVEEIREEWLSFLEGVYPDLPNSATVASLAQVMIFLLREYRPPFDEILEAMEVVINAYALVGEHDKAKMN